MKNENQSNASEYTALRQKQQEEEKEAAGRVISRRYVGAKESLGFIIWDAAQSFNINIFSERFITSIVGIDLGLQTIVNAINSVWDIVNDMIFGAIVD